jgi:transposase
MRLAKFPDKKARLCHNFFSWRGGKKRLERLRKRRLKAVQMFEQGARQATVAHILRVSRQSVSEWWLAWHNHDTKKLEGAERAGRKARLQSE